MMRIGLASLVLASVVLAFARSPGAAEGGSGFDRCEAAVRDHPERKGSFRCFWEVARESKAWDEAARRLEAHLALDGRNPRAKLTLAAVEWDRGASRAEQLYREAAEGFAAIGDEDGEVFSRMGLAGFLRQSGRQGEAEPILEQALVAARRSGDPVLVARVRIDQTVQAFGRSDFGEALRLLGEAESIVAAAGSKDLRARVLADKGYACWELGLYRRSLESYSAQADLLRETGAAYEEARARQSIAVLANELKAEGSLDGREVVRLEREALDAAIRSGNRTMEASSRVLLSRHLEPKAAIAELERALALARQSGDRHEARFALLQLARRSFLASPGRSADAFRMVEEAAQDSRASGDLEGRARAAELLAAMRHRTGPRERWIEESLRALDAIERIRDLQPEATVRARAFAPWALAYSGLAGQLLAGVDASPDATGDLALAFSTLERMRARTLLDELERAGTRPRLDPSDPDLRRRDEIVEEISRVQRTLVEGKLTDGERSGALVSLDRLEGEEADLRDAIARRLPEFARWHPTNFANLAAVQTHLEPDQALLSFDLAPENPEDGNLFDSGGSWVVLVTRGEARAFRLPDRSVLDDRIAVFLGLCRRADGSEGRAAARLYSDLLESALREAGPSIRKLVLVPDAGLNRLPFAALREDANGPPVAARYEIESVASATLWVRCRGSPAEGAAQRDALILADPETTAGEGRDATSPPDPPIERGLLGRLPFARREARALARELGPGSLVLLGAQASESALKRFDLRPYGLVHFAAHAVVDEAHPERSAVVLSPGGGGEDGLLQIRDIVNLPLEGRVIVLSSCRSATGTDLAGEGVLGLARAFFEAGARAVVATLWPVRDEDAAAFSQALARELGRGRSVSAANAMAEREAIRAGRPAAAWAGTVVLGDGGIVLRPGGAFRRAATWPWMLAVALLALAAATLAAAWRRDRTASGRTVRS